MLLVNKMWEIPIWIEVLFCFSFILYLMIALRNFYRSSWLGAFLKANTISFLYMMIIVPVAAIGIIMVAFMLY
jgi:ATP/ADP translocase